MILVTGGTGLIGAATVRELVRRGKAVALDRHARAVSGSKLAERLVVRQSNEPDICNGDSGGTRSNLDSARYLRSIINLGQIQPVRNPFK